MLCEFEYVDYGRFVEVQHVAQAAYYVVIVHCFSMLLMIPDMRRNRGRVFMVLILSCFCIKQTGIRGVNEYARAGHRVLLFPVLQRNYMHSGLIIEVTP